MPGCTRRRLAAKTFTKLHENAGLGNPIRHAHGWWLAFVHLCVLGSVVDDLFVTAKFIGKKLSVSIVGLAVFPLPTPFLQSRQKFWCVTRPAVGITLLYIEGILYAVGSP